MSDEIENLTLRRLEQFRQEMRDEHAETRAMLSSLSEQVGKIAQVTLEVSRAVNQLHDAVAVMAERMADMERRSGTIEARLGTVDARLARIERQTGLVPNDA